MQLRDERLLVEVASEGDVWNSAYELHTAVPTVSSLTLSWYQ